MATSSRPGRWPGSPSSPRPSAGSGSWRSSSRSCSRSTGPTSAARPRSCSSGRRPAHRCRPSSSSRTSPGSSSTDHLPQFFGEWERWIVEVLDSHVAYPLLGYFRSSHDNLSWISALGTVLDTATLVLTTIDGVPRGQAELAKALGDHLVEDITNLGNRTPASTSLDRPSFDAVYAAARGRRLPAGAGGRGVAGVRRGARVLRRSTRADGRLLGRAVRVVVRRQRGAPVADAPAGG